MYDYEQLVRHDNVIYHYVVTEDRTVVITKCDSNIKKIKIPQEIDGLPVVKIDDLAFFSLGVLREVTIPKFITEIGFRSFAECTSLRKINFTESLLIIGKSAFEGCTALRGVSLPSTLKKIEQDAFSYCEALKYIDIPSTIKVISKRSFKNTAIEELIVPEGVTKIESRAFENCQNLKKVLLSSTVISIKPNSFYNCLSLEEFDAPIDNNIYKTDKGVLYRINGKEIKLISFPSGKTDVTNNISNITTHIGKLAFYKTKDNIISLPESISNLAPKAFFGILSEEIHIPKSVTMLEDSTFSWCENLKRIKIEEGSQDLNLAAFYCCENISSVILPESIKTINIPSDTSFIKNITFVCIENSFAYKKLKDAKLKINILIKEENQDKKPKKEIIEEINDKTKEETKTKENNPTECNSEISSDVSLSKDNSDEKYIPHVDNKPRNEPERSLDDRVDTVTVKAEKPSESIVEENKEETEEDVIITYTNSLKSEGNKDAKEEKTPSEDVPVQQDETSSVNDSDLFDLNFADDNSSVNELDLVDNEVITPDEFISPVVDEETIRINKDVDEDLLVKKENDKEQAVTELMEALSLGEKSAEEKGWVPLEEVEKELIDDNSTIYEETVIENKEENNENIEEGNKSCDENVNEEKLENQERVSEEVTEENNDEEDDDALVDLYIDLDSL